MRDIAVTAAKLLQLVKDGFDFYGVELPEVAYVAPGNTVAFDGPQLTVNLTNIGFGSPGAEEGTPLPFTEQYYASLQVCIIRDTPGLDDDGNAPSVDALTASGKENLTDCVTLTQVLLDIRNSSTPGDPAALVDSPWLIATASATPIGPEGGVAGAVAVVHVGL